MPAQPSGTGCPLVVRRGQGCPGQSGPLELSARWSWRRPSKSFPTAPPPQTQPSCTVNTPPLSNIYFRFFSHPPSKPVPSTLPCCRRLAQQLLPGCSPQYSLLSVSCHRVRVGTPLMRLHAPQSSSPGTRYLLKSPGVSYTFPFPV